MSEREGPPGNPHEDDRIIQEGIAAAKLTLSRPATTAKAKEAARLFLKLHDTTSDAERHSR